MRRKSTGSMVEAQFKSPRVPRSWQKGVGSPHVPRLWPKLVQSPRVPQLVLQNFQIHRLYRNGGSFSTSRYTSYIGMFGPSVYPDTRVIPKWWVLQYIQIHEIISEWLEIQHVQVQIILEQLTTQFHIFKCIDFEFGCESRSSGSFRWIRLVKLVSKKSISAFARYMFGGKLNFL